MKKPEENAPRMKYFSAASCDSNRRRRAIPVSRYSGSDMISSATNIVSRSLAATKSIIPPTANSSRGQISVCSQPAVVKSRSSSEPGTVEARGAKASPAGSTLRSAMKSAAMAPTTSTTPCRKRAGPSAAYAPDMTTSKVPSASTTATKAAISAAGTRTRWIRRRERRGAKASTSTPTAAVPSTIATGAMIAQSIVGGTNSATS